MNKKTLLDIVVGLPDSAELESITIKGYNESRSLPGITPSRERIEITITK